MTIYTDTFGGANIYPSEISYSAATLSADVVLNWPEETSESDNLATKIIDVTPASAGLSITLPDATKSGTGNTILFNNKGAYTCTIYDADAVQVGTIASGTLWQVYLTSNTTEAGTWSFLQYGAATSTANASALAGTGIKAVGTLLSQSVPVTEFNSDYTAGVNDRAKFYNWTSSGAGVLTLPDPTVVANNWFMYLRNSGDGNIVATAPGVTTIDDETTLAFQPGESAIIASDGTNYYTIGFGQPADFAFDYTVIDVSGTGTYTLTGTELNRIVYRFTGVLTGDRDVVVPDTVQQYWVDNQTTGSYILTITTAAGAGVTIAAGQRAIFYCDGTDVVDADSSTLSLPMAVNQGGTGAITAGGALINLGGTSVGIALFTAVDEAAAWATLGPAQAGNVDGGTF